MSYHRFGNVSMRSDIRFVVSGWKVGVGGANRARTGLQCEAVFEEGAYLRLIDLCINELWAAK